jgi:phytoene dehydrogenase-like protein
MEGTRRAGWPSGHPPGRVHPVRDADGREAIAWTDADRLEDHLLSLSPADARPIRALTRGIHDLAGLDLSVLQDCPPGMRTPLDWARLGMRMLPFVSATARWATVSAGDFARRFRDPFLRRAVPHLFG